MENFLHLEAGRFLIYDNNRYYISFWILLCKVLSRKVQKSKLLYYFHVRWQFLYWRWKNYVFITLIVDLKKNQLDQNSFITDFYPVSKSQNQILFCQFQPILASFSKIVHYMFSFKIKTFEYEGFHSFFMFLKHGLTLCYIISL